MNIQEILDNSSMPSDELHRTTYLRGRITHDVRPEYFRVYPIPNSEGTYLLIDRSDIAGDIYKFTKEELAGSGFIGAEVYKVPLRIGTKVSYIKVESHRFGETIDSISFDPNLPVGCNAAYCGDLPCCHRPIGGPCYCSTCCIAGAERQGAIKNSR